MYWTFRQYFPLDIYFSSALLSLHTYTQGCNSNEPLSACALNALKVGYDNKEARNLY